MVHTYPIEFSPSLTMASSSPAIHPITNPQSSTGTATAIDSTLSASGLPPAFRVFINQISDTVRKDITGRHSWSELLDRSAFSKLESLSEATQRIRKNYAYFRVTYIAIITIVLAVSLLTNPISLVFLSALLAAWLFLYFFSTSADPPLTLCGRQFSDFKTLALLLGSTIFIVFLTSIGSVLVYALREGR